MTETFRQIDDSVELVWAATDGAAVEAQTAIATVEGRLQSILTAERTALNFLGHLSGIATLTGHRVTLPSFTRQVYGKPTLPPEEM